MSASQTSVGTSVGEASVLTEQEFAAAVRRDGNLDNLGAGVDWDGPRCEDCRTPVGDGARLCGECGS